jgi:hypothetical protein
MIDSLGTIPVGVKDLAISLEAKSDLDIQLYALDT